MKSLLPTLSSLPQTMVAVLVAGSSCVSPGVASAAETDAWSVIGEQGMARYVLVPSDQAADSAAHERQIARLCDPTSTCFLNFYTNSTGAPVGMPLPDAIANEATAIYRHSMKNGARLFMWSCRLKIPGEQCF
jgi:hypothetical protein